MVQQCFFDVILVCIVSAQLGQVLSIFRPDVLHCCDENLQIWIHRGFVITIGGSTGCLVCHFGGENVQPLAALLLPVGRPECRRERRSREAVLHVGNLDDYLRCRYRVRHYFVLLLLHTLQSWAKNILKKQKLCGQ